MGTNVKKTGKKKRWVSFFTVSFSILLLSTILLWGVSSAWGYVDIQRVTIVTDGGKQISGIFYIPDTATAENPAPVVFNMHGRANTAHVCDTWALEEARRGYVVVSLDLFGCGESDLMPKQIDYAEDFYEYVKELDFIIPDQFVYIGFSMGNIPAYEMAVNHSDSTLGNIQVFNFRAPSLDCPTNLCVIKAQSDQYNYYNVGDLEVYEAAITEAFGLKEPVQRDTVYGDFAQRNVRKYVYAEKALHQTGGIDSKVIANIVTFLDQCSPMPNPISVENQVWGWQQVFALTGAISFIACLMALGKMLLGLPYFCNAICCEKGRNRGKRGKSLAANIAIAIVIPTATFVTFSTWGMTLFEKNSIVRAKNLNGIIFWLLLNMLITLAIMVFHYVQDKKKGEKLTLVDYAVAGASESKLSAQRIGKSFLLATLVAFAGFAWLGIVEAYTGVGYQFWILAVVTKTNSRRFLVAVPYMLCIFCVLFVSSIGMNTSRRLKDTGNETKDLLKNMAMNAAIAALPVALLLLYQYGGDYVIGTGQTPIPLVGGSVGALNFAFGFPFLMGSMACINTYFYRKTGNVWTGVFLSAIVAGLLASGGQPLSM